MTTGRATLGSLRRELRAEADADDAVNLQRFFKTGKGGGMPEVVASNLTRNTGGRYDAMNTSNALPDKMKALAEQLALDHRKMEAWYELDFQTDSTDFKPIDVGVARTGVRLEISDRRRVE